LILHILYKNGTRFAYKGFTLEELGVISATARPHAKSIEWETL